MSGATHTLGPWELDTEIDADDYGAVQRDGSRPLMRQYIRHAGPLGGRIGVCFQNCLVTSDDELHANARLIAAAPDLLEALQDLFGADMEHVLMGDGKDDQIEAIAKAKAAIANATGATS